MEEERGGWDRGRRKGEVGTGGGGEGRLGQGEEERGGWDRGFREAKEREAGGGTEQNEIVFCHGVIMWRLRPLINTGRVCRIPIATSTPAVRGWSRWKAGKKEKERRERERGDGKREGKRWHRENKEMEKSGERE